jgi:hypothetical protein
VEVAHENAVGSHLLRYSSPRRPHLLQQCQVICWISSKGISSKVNKNTSHLPIIGKLIFTLLHIAALLSPGPRWYSTSRKDEVKRCLSCRFWRRAKDSRKYIKKRRVYFCFKLLLQHIRRPERSCGLKPLTVWSEVEALNSSAPEYRRKQVTLTDFGGNIARASQINSTLMERSQ